MEWRKVLAANKQVVQVTELLRQPSTTHNKLVTSCYTFQHLHSTYNPKQEKKQPTADLHYLRDIMKCKGKNAQGLQVNSNLLDNEKSKNNTMHSQNHICMFYT